MLVLSLPLWKKGREAGQTADNIPQALTLGQILHIPGAKPVMLTFFCYCALEQTTGLWASSYLTLQKGIPAEQAAGFASLFFIGITVGRALSGFLTRKLSDWQMVRLGLAAAAAGIAALLLPLGDYAALAGLILIGLGCAPIYPCVIHATPERFGAEHSQAIIGVQMASAYLGTCLIPPLFGLAATHTSIGLLPLVLFSALILMAATHEQLLRSSRKHTAI